MRPLYFLLTVLILSIACNQSVSLKKETSYWMYVSSFTDAKVNPGIGIYSWIPNTGTFELQTVDSSITSSSYLAIDPDNSRLYSINDESISSFRINPDTGKLLPINHKSVTSEGPCYIAVAKNSKYLMVAYYVSGEIATYELTEDGAIGEEISKIHHQGSSITERQLSAHPHMITQVPDSNLIFVTDLGTDIMYAYSVSDNGLLELEPVSTTQLPAGYGPRHLAYHPSKPIVYVLGELNGEVTGFNYSLSTGVTSKINQVSTLPVSFTEYNKSADIHISSNGKFLYASNRGHNSIAVFEINSETGALTSKEIVPGGGDWPRAFEIDPSGRYLLVANKRSDIINVMALDQESGILKKGTVYQSVPAPQCIKFLRKSSL